MLRGPTCSLHAHVYCSVTGELALLGLHAALSPGTCVAALTSGCSDMYLTCCAGKLQAVPTPVQPADSEIVTLWRKAGCAAVMLIFCWCRGCLLHKQRKDIKQVPQEHI